MVVTFRIALRLTLLIPVLLIFSYAASAGDEKAVRLERVIVSEKRIENSVLDMPRSISVVDKERIDSSTQQLGLDESLLGVPGLYVQNRYNFAQDLRISLRGFGARSSFGVRGVKIIVDGIPQTLPDGQAVLDNIDLSTVGHIDVLRGAASSLYGNASGGVINIETQPPSEQRFVQSSIAVGEFGYEKKQIKINSSSDNASYWLNAVHQELEGYREYSRFENDILSGRLSLDIGSRGNLSVVFSVVDQPLAEDPGGIGLAQLALNRRAAFAQNVLFDAGEDLDQQQLGWVYKAKMPSSELLVRNYYVKREFNNKLPFVDGGAARLDRLFYGAGVQYTRFGLLSDSIDLSIGMDIEEQNDERERFDNNQSSIGALVFGQDEIVLSRGAYIQGDYWLTDNYQLSAGLRYDRLRFDVNDAFFDDGDDSGEVSFDEVSPSLGISYHFDSGILYALYNRSFETPTTTELANPSGSGGFNTALDSQNAESYELGLKLANKQFYYELALFHIDSNDELVPFELGDFPGRTFFSNAGRSKRNGIETLFSYKNDNGISLDASYTWSDFDFEDFIDEEGNDFSSNQIPGVPSQFGNVALTYKPIRALYLRFDATYSGGLFADNANEVRVPSYVVSNLRAGWDIVQGDWKINPYIGVNNLFNELYNSNIRINAFGGRFFEPAPEREIYGGVGLSYDFQ